MSTTALRIETPEQYETWQQHTANASLYLVDQDGGPGPFLAWRDDNGNWHGTRAVSQDDGAWGSLPAAVRRTNAISTDLQLPVWGPGAAESFTPFWVLWDDTKPLPDDLDRILQSIGDERRDQPAHGWTPEYDKAMGGAPHLAQQASARIAEAGDLGIASHALMALRPLRQAAALLTGAIQAIEAANRCSFCDQLRDDVTRGTGAVNACADCLAEGETAR